MFANTQMGGVDTGFPDVCLTPAPPSPSPVPIPYPNIGAGPTASPAVYNVLFMYGPAHNLSSKTAVGVQWNRDRLVGSLSTANILPPGGRTIDVAKLQKLVKDRGFLIDGGYGKIKGTTFRLSNMGDETESSMQNLYAALDESMKQL